MRFLVVLPFLCMCMGSGGGVRAQSSPSYRVEEFAVNAGGNPRDGVTLHSTGYVMTLDAVGEALAAPLLQGAVRSMEVGFARGYPPPGEVRQLVLADKQTLAWSAERSVGAYRVYGGDLGSLPGGYGACTVPDVQAQQVLLDEVPEPGRGLFFLVTAENTLSEEGTKGSDSAGAERSNPAPCP